MLLFVNHGDGDHQAFLQWRGLVLDGLLHFCQVLDSSLERSDGGCFRMWPSLLSPYRLSLYYDHDVKTHDIPSDDDRHETQSHAQIEEERHSNE